MRALPFFLFLSLFSLALADTLTINGNTASLTGAYATMAQSPYILTDWGNTYLYLNLTAQTAGNKDLMLIINGSGLTPLNLEYFDGFNWILVSAFTDNLDSSYSVTNLALPIAVNEQYRFSANLLPNGYGEYSILLSDTPSGSYTHTMSYGGAIPSAVMDPWFSGTYRYREAITCYSSEATTITNATCFFKINHAGNVSAGRSLASGYDFLVTNNDSTMALNFSVENNTLNTAYTTITYLAPTLPGYPGIFNGYFYHGNRSAVSDLSNPAIVYARYTDYWELSETTGSIRYSRTKNLNFTNSYGTITSSSNCITGLCTTFGGNAGINVTLPGGTGDPYYQNSTLAGFCLANITTAGTIQDIMSVVRAPLTDFSWGLIKWNNDSLMFYTTPSPYSPVKADINKFVLYGFTRAAGPVVNIYMNGTFMGTSGGAYLAATTPVLTIGGGSASNPLTGTVDGCALASGAKAANINQAWLNMIYSMGYTVGPTEVNLQASSPELCANTTCTALPTLYANSTDLNASGICTSGETSIDLIGRFTYYRNGAMWVMPYDTHNWVSTQTNYSTNLIYRTFISKGENWNLGFNCYNYTDNSPTLFTANLTVNNTAPVLGGPSITGILLSGSTLTCNNGTYTDANGDAMNSTGAWRWFVNSTIIGGATLQNYTIPLSSATNIYICEWTASDTGYDMKTTRANSTGITIMFNTFNVYVFDEITALPLNFSIVIQNSTNSNNSAYQSAYSKDGYSIPTGTNVYIAVSNASYGTRTYYRNLIPPLGLYILNAYLLPASSGTNYTIQVVNQYLTPVSGAYIVLSRAVNSTWVTIGEGTTDFTGTYSFSLQPGTPYILNVTASGYAPVSVQFIPGATTSVQVRISPIGQSYPLPNYNTVFNDVSYKITPSQFFNTNATTASFTVVSASSSLSYYTMVLTRYYNGTTTVLVNTTVTTQPAGGAITYLATLNGTYTIAVSFKHVNFTEYRPLPVQFYIGTSGGISQTKDLFATGFLNGWAFFLLAVIFAMVAGGYVLQYSADAAPVVSLLVLWGFTFLNPNGIIVTLGSVGVTVLYAVSFTTMMTAAAMVLKWWG